MFQARPHIPALHASDVGSCHFAGQIWILRQILKITSAKRAPLDIYSRAKQNAHVFCLAFLSERPSHFIHEICVKAGSCGASCREADCLNTFSNAKVIRFTGLLSQSMRPI